MTQHPHAEVLRAIADGVPLSEFEWDCSNGWFTVEHVDWVLKPNIWQIRRKPKHIIVNGFKVPKPLDVMPKMRHCYAASDSGRGDFCMWLEWTGDKVDCLLFERGLAHATKEAAIAHAKAMLGIDPEYFK